MSKKGGTLPLSVETLRSGRGGKRYPSVPELANLGGKQHPMDIVFPLISSNFTMDFPLLSTKNAIICSN